MSMMMMMMIILIVRRSTNVGTSPGPQGREAHSTRPSRALTAVSAET